MATITARSIPHAWQSIANAKVYVTNIRDGLITADPAGKDAYTANAAAYIAKLDALEGEVKAAMAAIPAAQRRVITCTMPSAISATPMA